jgi:hypothetical protein
VLYTCQLECECIFIQNPVLDSYVFSFDQTILRINRFYFIGHLLQSFLHSNLIKIRVFANNVLFQQLIAMTHRFYINIGVHGDGVQFVVLGFALEIFSFEFGNDAQDVVRFI